MLDLLIPLLAFSWRVGIWTLNPHAAPAMAESDWATYIAAPNYLRSAPILSWPIGRVPNYIAPVGSSLGLSDATPILTPVYRIANALSPDQPVQLLGWLLLLAYAMAFWWSEKFLRAAQRALQPSGEDGIWSEAGIRIGAGLLIFIPFFVGRFGHIALMQQWVLIAALYVAIFRGEVNRSNTRCMLAISLVTAVVHPYFVPSVLLISAPYLIRLFRRGWKLGLRVLLVQVGGVLFISAALGYVGGGVSAANGGYGEYSADLAFLFSSHDTSRALRSIAYAPVTFEGMGFVGLGVLVLIVAAVVAVLSGVRFPTVLVRRTGVVAAMTIVLAVFAAFPVIHFAGRTIIDLRGTPFSLDFIGRIFRTNGRLVWSFAWLVALLAVCVVLAIPSRTKLGLLACAAVLQIHDVKPFRFPKRETASYASAVSVLRDEIRTGATRIEVEPPEIVYACQYGLIAFNDLAPVLLASSVIGLPINSGFPGRSVDAFVTDICDRQHQQFERGEYEDDVVYLMSVTRPALANLSCQPIGSALQACRTTAT